VAPKTLVEILFQLDARWQPVTIAIEGNNNRQILYPNIVKMGRETNKMLPITWLSHTTKSKYDRIQGLEPRYATSTILHPTNHKYLYILESELRRFPRSKTDDVSDALSMILEIAVP